MKRSPKVLIHGCLLLLSLVQCRKGGGRVGSTAEPLEPGVLTMSPVDLAGVSGLVPLGNLNPPGHTFPTQHMYIYFLAPGREVNVFAPGHLRIYQAARFRNVATGFADYRLEFGDPAGTTFFLAHLSSLHPTLLEKLGAFSAGSCEIYTTGGTTFEYCRKQAAIDVDAGEIIATAAATAESYNIDMGVRVKDVAACPLDYFAASVKALMEAKSGTASGSFRRLMLPLCGRYNLDVPGTLQGNWYKQGVSRQPEDQHVAFVTDNVQPDKLRISIGNTLPGLAAGVYGTGIPGMSDDGNTTGRIDRRFTTVIPDGQIYCYTLRSVSGATVVNTSLIAKLDDNNTLSLERRSCGCDCLPYAFSAAKVTYTR